MDATRSPSRIAGIELVPGATLRQLGAFILVQITMTVMFQFISIIQPYIYSEVMHVAIGEQGRLTGLLQTIQYAAVALFIIPVGGVADRVGRKPVILGAMIGFIVTLVFLPFCAAIIAMIGLRCFFGAVSTGQTIGGATVMIDFPANKSRGKYTAMMLIIQSLSGALFSGYLMTHVPGWLINGGFDKTAALRISVWGLAAAGAVGALFTAVFFKPPPRQTAPVRPQGAASLLDNARAVLRLSLSDPTFGLVVLVAFVVRSDVFVTSSFLSVWAMAAAKQQGATPIEALKTLGVLQTTLFAALGLAPILCGFIADRMNRTAMMVGSLVFAAAAFSATALIHDINGVGIIAVVAMIGLAETAQMIASQALFGERAPPELRGSAMGFFVLMGTLSVIVVSYISGQLFDKVSFVAPFLFLAALNVVFVFAAIVLVVTKRRSPKSG